MKAEVSWIIFSSPSCIPKGHIFAVILWVSVFTCMCRVKEWLLFIDIDFCSLVLLNISLKNKKLFPLYRRCAAILQDRAGSKSAPSGTQQAGADLYGWRKLAAGVQVDPQQHRAHAFLLGIQVREWFEWLLADLIIDYIDKIERCIWSKWITSPFLTFLTKLTKPQAWFWNDSITTTTRT